MDETAVRQHLKEVQQRLAVLDEEREVLLSLVRGYEGWLRLQGNSAGPQLTLGVTVQKKNPTAPKGTTSLRGAVLRAIKDAHGAPLHSKEILRRIQALGAKTEARNPVAIIDLTAYSLANTDGQPIKKVGPRTWRWMGQ
jgi:hypothetical protein